jgi:low affinity Fe/Cu permease
MATRKPSSFGARFEAFSTAVTRWTGSTSAFALALLVIVVWAVIGPVFHYSDTWQLVINTGTTIITFLMVFLIQRSQNKDSLALHLKLNELVELATLHRYYGELAKLSRTDNDVTKSHSVEEARTRHSAKLGSGKIGTKGK